MFEAQRYIKYHEHVQFGGSFLSLAYIIIGVERKVRQHQEIC